MANKIPDARHIKKLDKTETFLEEFARQVYRLGNEPYLSLGIRDLSPENVKRISDILVGKGYFTKPFISAYVNTNCCPNPGKCFAYHPPIYAPVEALAVSLDAKKLPPDVTRPEEDAHRQTLVYTSNSYDTKRYQVVPL